ncbi:MAG TPA: PRC-barrel domain-containing protein [Bacteroidota bacterium]|nr:PRC-barrel domain-containing protein [Bacteroidota bacterium]
MVNNVKGKLVKLVDSSLAFVHLTDDIRGRKVLDRHSEEIGTIDALYIDDKERKVRFIRVASGGILGIGKTTFLIPAAAIVKTTGEAVHIDLTRTRVAKAPIFDPDLVEENELQNLYRHYGYLPYWGSV